MDSAHVHQLQDQLQLVASSSSSSSLDNNSDPSCYGASSAHQWSPGGISLNTVSLSHSYNNEMLINTRNQDNNTSECMSLSNIHNHSLIQHQDFPLQWPHDQSSYHHHDQGLHKIKEELSSSTTPDHQQGMPKFTDMLNSPDITNYLKINEHKDYSEKLLVKTISSGFPINGDYSSSLPSSSSSSSSPSSQSHRGSFSLETAAWNFVHDWLRTTLCLQYKPHVIATATVHLAATFQNAKVGSRRDWWLEFGVTTKLLKEVIQEMCILMEVDRRRTMPPPPPPPRRELAWAMPAPMKPVHMARGYPFHSYPLQSYRQPGIW